MSTDQTSELVLTEPRNATAANRSRLYALFAEALAYPAGSVALRLLDGDWFGEVRDAYQAVSHPAVLFNTDTAADDHGTIETLKSEYSALFDVGSASPAISLLERRYVDTPEQQLWARLLEFYSHFGLDFSRGYAAEQPDHLLTELSFMHYLSYLEAGAARGVEDLRRGQRDFLSHHLSRLSGGLCGVIRRLDNVGLYGRIIEAAAAFVAADVTYCDTECAV